MTAKEALDALFSKVDFSHALYKKLVYANVEFITSTIEHKNLFGSRLIGNHHIRYTKYEKNIFYQDLFGLDVEEVISAITNITSIPKNFKIARDDINLVTFYIAHRFLSNPTLKTEKRLEYAKEALTYFSYRTLVLLSSTYFVYPISEEKAVSLSERLSNKYIIKQVKNWNEYCQYRSNEYINSKYVDLLISFNKDKDLPNAITDLFNRTKDTLKNIYKEFLSQESTSIIKSSKNVMTDGEGKEVMVDRTDDPSNYINKAQNTLTDRHTFIRKDLVDVAVDVVNSVSYTHLSECLTVIHEYYYKDRNSTKEVNNFIHDYLVVCFDYLYKNRMYIGTNLNVIKIVNSITGSILYARSTEITIVKFKDEVEKLIKKAYKHSKTDISSRNIKNVRNGLCVYVLLLALV